MAAAGWRPREMLDRYTAATAATGPPPNPGCSDWETCESAGAAEPPQPPGRIPRDGAGRGPGKRLHYFVDAYVTP